MIKFLAGATACLVGLCAGYGLASRNSSGTMAAINGPYTSGTVISSSVINARLADIETEITDSKSRSGKGDFSAPVRAADGVVTAPAFSFTSETGTGLYRIGSSDLGLSINQTKTGEWTANGYRTSNGAVGTPSLSFFNDTGSGLYRIGSNDIGFAVNGALKTEWNANGFGLGAAPTYPLDVLTAANTDVNARFVSSGAMPLFVVTASTVARLGFNLRDNGSNAIYDQSSGGAVLQGEPGSSAVVVYTAPTGGTGGNTATLTERLRVNTTGVTVANVLTVSGTSTLTGATTATGGITIGSGGTATTQMNFGSCVTNAGTPSVCTATVAAGAKCVANLVGTSASTDSVTTSVSSTTLTITVQNGVAKTANYICF